MANLALVVLAAGMGTRMKSALPKVLHKVAGRSMLSHVLHAGQDLGAVRAVVVHGPGMDAVIKESASVISGSAFAEQRERLGTGHAVSMSKDALTEFKGQVLVLINHLSGSAAEMSAAALRDTLGAVSYTHLTLPTNREV